MRKAFTTHTYTNVPMPPNTHTHTHTHTHTTELRLASDNAPQHHSDGGIDYTLGNNRIMTTNQNPQTHAHLCNRKDADPQPHTHGQYHLPQKNTDIPLVPKTDRAIRQDAKQDGIACTTQSGPTLASTPIHKQPQPPSTTHNMMLSTRRHPR